MSEDDRFSGEFTITPSVVSIKFNAPNATLTKVYDGNRTVPTSQINDSYFSWSATGHNPTRNPFKVTAQYDNKNVGDKKAVTFSYTFTDPTNVGDYVVGTVDGSAYTVGQITPAHIRVALDKLRSGKATRTYTDDEFYGGAEGATGNGRSKTYRTGEGFTVSGVLGSDNINVVARYQEADNTRNSNSGNYFDFSKYVNDVYKDADGTFKKASAGKYFKKLVFTMTGTDAANYTFNVYDSSAEGGNKYSESDSTAAAIQSVTVYDSRDSKNKNASGAASIQIEITVKSVRVEYSDTAQSYANDDNTYNTNWKPITGTNKDMDKADAKIKVSNGWMYADGKDHTAEEGYTKREYRGYTTIRGSQNSERLGAKVDPTNGMDLNYRLSNQPTLTIAYFVSTGDEYEINSLARLLIASFYYTASQNPGNLEIIKIVSSGYKWVSVVSADDYDKGEFELPQDTPITDSKATTWDEYFTELEAKGYSVFLNIEANAQDNIPANTWGYYATTTSESSTIPTSYKLTKDIVGKFTESDISILNTFFTVIGDDGKTTTSTWSGNGTYLKNVLKAAEGKIATINGSLFVSTAKTEEAGDVTGFGGTFDGNGYVIEYLNIMGYGKDNVGLFDVIGANGIVKNLHLRNVTINGNAKYVGGIAGKVLAAADALTEKSVKNVSFHGSINVTGSTDQSVGGLFGISERAVENAIVLGSITVSNVNAKVGGVVGTATAGLNNVVSMMQITASGGTVGAFTSNNAHVGENCTHMTNAVWKKDTSGTGFENVDGKNVGYNDLMSGSVSGYGTTNKYYHESETSVTKGEYDVLDDVVLTKISVDNKENARQSMRLADIVKVYLLMYSLNETQATDSGNLNGANVYAISTSSWLVGTADGTTAKPIAIANKQNVSLLRELRFASFTLKANVSIEIASTFSGAFYGSVTSATNESGTSYGYKITCDKAMFEAYSNDTTAWLSVQ
ncbi:gLUG domain protein [Firmicutes bacterium CAG:475]|nr:gLUG domain protein [Firmicutes bacterium CAG:475]